jgi:hypothetical protein
MSAVATFATLRARLDLISGNGDALAFEAVPKSPLAE